MPTDTALESSLTFLELARLRFKRCAEAEDAQRKAMLEAKKFRAGDQWPEAIKVQRAGGQAIQGRAAEPARPCLTIDRISAPTRQVSNTVRAANFAIDVHPNGFGADDETARILKGLLRQIQNDARGEDPIEWAADGAAEGGIGWFRVYADYCYNDPDQVSPEALRDQDLKIGRIANSLSVYCDPSAQLPTRADAAFMFVTEDLSKAEFAHRYGKENLPTADEFRSIGDQDGWIGDDLVRMAEYWTCDYKEIKVYQSPDGTVTKDGTTPNDYDPKEQGWWTRVIRKPEVKCAYITAYKTLKKWDWPGTRIPLFPVLGEELNVDGRIVLRGVIASAMDPQRMVNYLYSGTVEQSALGSKSPYLAAAGQIDNYKAIWQNANTTNFAYLPYDPISIAGTAVPPPQRQTVEPPIQAMVQLLQISEEAIKATTSIYDPSLGNTNPREKSGRAIMAMQQQAEHANSNYVDNVQRAMVDCGNELVKLCPTFYDRPGRVLKIAGISDQPEQVTLGPSGQPGQPPQPPQAAGPPAPPQATPQQAQGMQQFYDLSKGNYSVTVGVSKAHSTKREETNAIVGDLISSNPQLMGVFGDIFFRNLEQPELEDRAKKMLAPQVQQGNGQPDVNQMQAQMQQAGQMIDMMGKELQAKTQIIETDAIKSQERLKEKQIDAQTRIEVAQIQAAAQLAAVDAKVNAENARTFVEAIEAKIAKALDAHMEKVNLLQGHAHEVGMQAVDHAHEQQMAQHQAAVGAISQGADQQHEADLTAQQQAHEQAIAEQQAAQAPQKGVE